MIQLCHKRFDESCLGRLRIAMVMLLCLFILVHMLGVPITLMNPVEVADTMGASILEGFSVPQTVPQLTLLSKTIPVDDTQSLMHMPVLISDLFHPPRL
jgi:hypothetical protein